MAEATILDRIVQRKWQEVAEAKSRISEHQLLEKVAEQKPPRRFLAALTQTIALQQPAIIAEVKLASPSKGRIYPADHPFDPAWIAEGYAQNGASCISCLTDKDFFQGDSHYLTAIHQRIGLPVLRKDFMVDPYQVAEARAMGADAILLIMAILSDNQAAELEDAAHQLAMDVLVEVHDEEELERAHELRTSLLGINNRNLKTFQTSLETSVLLSRRAHASRLVVAESGIHSRENMDYLQSHGIHAFLIGEMFMRHQEPGKMLGELLGRTP
ncbi:MAG: indole-3-glycerol phosphate synthase TrpC [Magnetococcales bacterium]|nr:indole-3-glycerol phosphate synthase TrpC [Magnetococcales bacterium]NGZ28295.1 indole-3-glycerol phosphate synthase TrpC [Magnetococcales bacterium]